MGSRTSSTTTIGNPHPTICTRTISSLPTPTTSNFTITNPTSTFPTSNIPSTTISTPIISLPTPPATAATNTASPVIACDHSSVGSQVYAGGLTIQTTAATITPYYMQYTATDALGNTATPVVRSSPLLAPATTSIKLGTTYKACASGQHPTAGAECELGATAQDSQNGNLISQVLVCAPAACTTLACISSESPKLLILWATGLKEWLLQRIDQTLVLHMSADLASDLTHNHKYLFKRLDSPVSLRQTGSHNRGHAFYSVGLAPYNLDTAAAALGTTIEVPFSVLTMGHHS
ncbi:TPA: hypothetical protein ACH3X1_010668 [Trebouxia sp. C0004]